MIPPEEAVKTVEFLKAVADDPEAPLTDVARDLGITSTTATRLIKEFVAMLASAAEDPHYPAKVLDYYNVNLPKEAEPLNEEDVGELTPLIDKYHKRLINKSKPTQRQGTMSSNYPTGDYTNQQGMAQPGYSNPVYPGGVPTELDEESALLKWILETTYNPRPHLVERFIRLFQQMKHRFQQNPLELLGLLKHNFGPQAGELAYQTWVTLRSQYVNDPNTLYQMTGAASGLTQATVPGMMPGAPPGSSPMGMGPMNAEMAAAMAEERRWERLQKMMERKMQIDLMKTMSQINQSQTPMNPDAANNKVIAHEEYDNHGRVIRRTYAPNPENGQSKDDRLYELILKQSLDRENILLTKMEEPMKWMQPIFTSLVTGHQNTTDPFTAASKMIEFTNQINQHRPMEGSRDKDIAKWEMDTKLALAELSLKREEIKHQWDREAAETARAEDTTEKYIDGIRQMGTELLKPIVNNFAAGLAARGAGPPMQQQTIQQGPPGYTPEQLAAIQQQNAVIEARRRAAALQRAKIMQQQQQMQQRQAQQGQSEEAPVEEQLSAMSDGQVEELAKRYEQQAREFEHTGTKIMKEVAKRRLINSPQRQQQQRMNDIEDSRAAAVQQQQDYAQYYNQANQGPVAVPQAPVQADTGAPRTAAVVGGDNVSTQQFSSNDREYLESTGQAQSQGMNFGVSVGRAPEEVPNVPEGHPQQVSESEDTETEEDVFEDEEIEEEEDVAKADSAQQEEEPEESGGEQPPTG